MDPAQEFDLEEAGGEPDALDDIVQTVVEQGRFVVQLITCLADVATEPAICPPRPNIHGTLVDFLKEGLYDYLVDEPNVCGVHVKVEEILSPEKSKHSIPVPAIVPALPEQPVLEVKYTRSASEESNTMSTKTPTLNLPPNRKLKCCPFCSIM